MARTLRVALLVILLCLSLLQIGCCCCTWAVPVRRNPIIDRFGQAAGSAGRRDVDRFSVDVSEHSGTREIEFDVSAARKRIVLEAKLKVEQGTISWTLTDPTGMVRWRDTVAGRDTYRDRVVLPPLVGQWTLTLDIRNGTGSIDVVWDAE